VVPFWLHFGSFSIHDTEQILPVSRFCPINSGFRVDSVVSEKKLPFLKFCSVFVRENRTVLPIHPKRKEMKDKMDSTQQR
jgi:hypothetical protein